MKYIIGIDEGTTSARAVLFNTETNEIEKISRGKFKQYFPHDTWVEHNAEEIFKVVKKALTEITDGLTSEDIFGLGITNQRESVVAWSKSSGKALAPSICWQDRRTAEFCKNLKQSKVAKIIKQKTGLMPDSYFSASKIKWLIENNKDVKNAYKKHDLLVGTIECFLVYKLTKGKVFVTDVTNASRTQLLNIKTLDWDDELLKIFGINKEILPRVVSNSEVVGTTKINGCEIKIAGLCGDQQSSLFGQGGFYKGGIKNTYGTGSFLLKNIGSNIVYSKNLLTTVAYKIGNNICYALEGSVYNCGTVVDWATKDLGLFSSPKELDECAASIKNCDNVYFVPALTGLGCPYWNMDASGIFCGITRATSKAHLAKAILNGIALSVYDVVKVLESESHSKTKVLKADGGVTNNPSLMQFQADILNCEINVTNSESTVLGAIFLAGLATGAYKDLKDIEAHIEIKKTFTPHQDKKQLKTILCGWQNAVAKCNLKELKNEKN